jgi:hypothetical protein
MATVTPFSILKRKVVTFSMLSLMCWMHHFLAKGRLLMWSTILGSHVVVDGWLGAHPCGT